MKIALIGGHGKIALLLAPLLTQRGDEVTSVVRNPDHTGDVAATGAGGGDPQRTYAVDRDAAIRTMDAAAQTGVDRFVMVSYFGASPDHGVANDNPFFAYAEAKAAADKHLRASSLDWTVLGPSGLTDDQSTGRIDTHGEQADSISRADVAAVIAEVLGRSDTHHRTIRFNTGDVPIAEAMG